MEEAMTHVRRACERVEKATCRQLLRRVRTLRTLAWIAPSLGFWAILPDLIRMLKLGAIDPCGGECAGGPSEMFVIPCIGLLVTSVVMFCYGVLKGRAERLCAEIHVTKIELLCELGRLTDRP